jgi:hypothetical protein
VLLRFAGLGFYRCTRCHKRFVGWCGWGRRQWQCLGALLGTAAFAGTVWGVLSLISLSAR